MPEFELTTTTQVMDLLRLSRDTFCRLAVIGELPGRKVSRTSQVLKDEIEQYVRGRHPRPDPTGRGCTEMTPAAEVDAAKRRANHPDGVTGMSMEHRIADMRTSRTDASGALPAGPPLGTRRSLKRTLLLWFLATSLIPLCEAASRQEEQDWFKTAQAELGDQMHGEQELASLARKVITYLAKYLSAQIGAFYVHDGQGRLKLLGSYALSPRKNRADEFGFGEGTVGQAALEKEHILLTNVPDDCLAVSSGLGEAPPRNILLWPIVREDEVKGVIELSALESFRDGSLDLLKQVTESVAIAMEVAQSRRRQQDLLEQSRAQSESATARTVAGQARGEELQATNWAAGLDRAS